MTAVGRHPALHELLEALHAICKIEADADALNPEAPLFRVVLTFQREQCPEDWVFGEPKPSWLIDQIIEELHAWESQCIREEQWVSKEEQMGASIDTIMAHWTEELKKNAAIRPENMLTRMQKKILANTILRLKELQERRAAGGVYSAAGERRDKASKAWMEDEYEAPRREEAQRQAHARMNPGDFGFVDPEVIRKMYEDAQQGMFTHGFSADWGNTSGDYRQQQYKPTPKPSGNKRPWHEILGVQVGATKDDIKKAHRKLAAKYHPDRYKEPDGHARMAEINTARDEGLGGL